MYHLSSLHKQLWAINNIYSRLPSTKQELQLFLLKQLQTTVTGEFWKINFISQMRKYYLEPQLRSGVKINVR